MLWSENSQSNIKLVEAPKQYVASAWSSGWLRIRSFVISASNLTLHVMPIPPEVYHGAWKGYQNVQPDVAMFSKYMCLRGFWLSMNDRLHPTEPREPILTDEDRGLPTRFEDAGPCGPLANWGRLEDWRVLGWPAKECQRFLLVFVLGRTSNWFGGWSSPEL